MGCTQTCRPREGGGLESEGGLSVEQAPPETPAFAGVTAWAEMQLHSFEATATHILTERTRLNSLPNPSRTSSGGGCRLYEARTGAVALNLARADDRDMLPALFESAALESRDDAQIADAIAGSEEAALVTRGREMGLAIAGLREDRSRASPAIEHFFPSTPTVPRAHPPKVIDLSALWAGPLATRLLRHAGAEVIKIESTRRPDAMRAGDPEFYQALNAEKQELAIDFHTAAGIAALRDLLATADIVIESARPRALLQLGVDADALVQATPGQIWISVTGHGVRGEAANWVGFGDDCGVAGGLSAAHFDQTGELAFVGDAIADPLTGITAARVAAEAWAKGEGGRWFLSMSGIVAEALRPC